MARASLVQWPCHVIKIFSGCSSDRKLHTPSFLERKLHRPFDRKFEDQTKLVSSRSMRSRKELREAEEFFHAKIPLTRAMGVRVVAADERGFAVEAPVALNYNHLHTAFGGSINAVATLAGYGFLWLELRDSAAEIVVAESTIRFRAPVRETIRAICASPDSEMLATFKASLRSRGKARITLEVRVEEGDSVAAEFTGTFVAVTRKRA